MKPSPYSAFIVVYTAIRCGSESIRRIQRDTRVRDSLTLLTFGRGFFGWAKFDFFLFIYFASLGEFIPNIKSSRPFNISSTLQRHKFSWATRPHPIVLSHTNTESQLSQHVRPDNSLSLLPLHPIPRACRNFRRRPPGRCSPPQFQALQEQEMVLYSICDWKVL